jgi:DNA-binding NarL/FixJ family response regulator
VPPEAHAAHNFQTQASCNAAEFSFRDAHGMPLRCVIVDDSPALLAAARSLLERGGIAVVGVATTVAAGREVVERLQPDVTLVDIDLGPESGFDLARQLASNDAKGSRSILISTHAERDFRDLIGESPALGFLPKSQLSAKAIEALLNASPET